MASKWMQMYVFTKPQTERIQQNDPESGTFTYLMVSRVHIVVNLEAKAMAKSVV